MLRVSTAGTCLLPVHLRKQGLYGLAAAQLDSWVAIWHRSQSFQQLVPVICNLINMGDADLHACTTLQPGSPSLGTSLHMAFEREFCS